MLVSGVLAGIAAGLAFGGNWHRLASISIRLWPVLAIAAGLRILGAVYPLAPLGLYLTALIGIALVAAVNWRLPGAALIAVGTLMNTLVVLANSGMPYDAALAGAMHVPI